MGWNNVSVAMRELVCATCGVAYSMPEHLYKRKIEDNADWWCPNGHQWHYGKSESEKKIERLERELGWKNNQLDRTKRRAETAERSANAYKGKLRSVSKKITAGVCPHCRRTFQNLKKHMTCKHPDEVAHAHGKKGKK